MDTKLADALANRLYVARVAEREAAHPTSDLRLGPSIPQAGEPVGESPSLTDLDHLQTIGDTFWPVNYGRQMKPEIHRAMA